MNPLREIRDPSALISTCKAWLSDFSEMCDVDLENSLREQGFMCENDAIGEINIALGRASDPTYENFVITVVLEDSTTFRIRVDGITVMVELA